MPTGILLRKLITDRDKYCFELGAKKEASLCGDASLKYLMRKTILRALRVVVRIVQQVFSS